MRKDTETSYMYAELKIHVPFVMENFTSFHVVKIYVAGIFTPFHVMKI